MYRWLAYCWLSLLCFQQPSCSFHIRSQPTQRILTTTTKGKLPSYQVYSWQRRISPLFPSVQQLSSDGSDPTIERALTRKRKKLVITLWIHVISVFVIANYVRSSCWPGAFMSVPISIWNLIHGLSAMIFAGSIITTTVLEWTMKDASTIAFFPKLLKVETSLVLPALTGSMISGVAQAFHTYSSLRHAPRHVKSVLHLLFVFGLWWGLTDRRSQGKVVESIATREVGDDLLRHRRISNLVSCIFLFVLYSVMILKPGYSVV